MLEKKVFIGMNTDNSPKDMRPEEFRKAVNLVAVTDGVGTSARLENMLGMRETGMPVGSPSSPSTCIGLWNYREGNKIYGFYAGRSDYIIEYDGVTDVGTVLVSNDQVFDFRVENPVYDVFIIENLLYFNDGLHGIRKINIDYAKTGALNSITDERSISLIKPPPLKALSVNRKTDTNLTQIRPEIRNTPLQFATRYVYSDDEISVISPISRIAPPLDWDKDDNHWNYVEVVLHIDQVLTPIIDRVELLYRDGNDGVWTLYNKFDPSAFTITNADGTKSTEYDVYLDRSGGVLSEQEAGQGSESVPRLSDAMALMENRLFATSSLEEFNTEEDEWNCLINLSGQNAASGLNNEIYYPYYYKEDAEYKWGIVFMDEYGRKTAPIVRDLMVKKIPETLTGYTIVDGGQFTPDVLYSHPIAYRASPTLFGKPPSWATKYQFVRTENRSYRSWFKEKFVVKPLYSTEPKTEEPDASLKANLGVYLEDGYWYYSTEFWLRKFDEGAIPEDQVRFYGRHYDLVIPDGIPITIDKTTIVKMGLDYDQVSNANASKKKKYTITNIENGKIRVTGLSWIDIKKVFYDEIEATYGEIPPGSIGNVLPDNYHYIHFELLNPLKKNETPLMYEVGTVYDIVNPKTPNRAFQFTHGFIDGDCYYTCYNENWAWRSVLGADADFREGRFERSVSYCSISPIGDLLRAGNPIGLTPEGEIEPTSVEGGQYWKTAHNSKGRPTVEVPNQQELRRGSQVRFSRNYIQDSLINGLSNFPEENKYALSFDRGNIVKLVATNESVLVAIHTRSITSLYINRKFINAGEGEAFLAQTDQVIGDDRKLLLNYGTTHPESVVLHDSRIYGFDSIMSEPWRRSLDGVTPLALTYGMKTYFEEKGEQIRRVQTIDPSARITILGGYDQWLDMYVLTFSEINYVDNGTPIKIDAETLGFSEKVKRWVSFYSFKPDYYSSIMNNLVSAKGMSLYRHMDTEDRNLFYGEYYNSSITIVSNESNDLPKIYRNLGISSNRKWSMTCNMPDGKESLLETDNFVLRDNVFYANMLRDKNTPSDVLRAGQTALLHGEKMIGETMEITLTNDDAERVILDAVYIGYSPMTGHLLSQR